MSRDMSRAVESPRRYRFSNLLRSIPWIAFRPGSHTLRHACVQRLVDAGYRSRQSETSSNPIGNEHLRQRRPPTGDECSLRKPFRHLNNHSDRDRNRIHFASEPLFTSARNRCSHRRNHYSFCPESALCPRGPRKRHRAESSCHLFPTFAR